MFSRALRMALGVACGAFALAAPAVAAASPEYGEVTRFGGFDSAAFNSGHYGGATTPGAFLDPTGFAVDMQDNTVYVVDRTSRYAHNPTTWRIQQFSPGGAVLGSTTFTLPNGLFGASAIEGLAVDHRAGRLYALVVGSPLHPNANPLTPVAQELLAWSTTATGGGGPTGGELQAAPGLASDPMNTSGGLIATAEQLQSGATPLYAPQGIAVDPLGLPGVADPVAIEASDLLPGVGRGNPISGDTLVQQVATQSEGATRTGELLSQWSGASVSDTLGGSWGPLGISTSPDGGLVVLVDASNLSATDAYVIKLKADLSDPVVLNRDATEPPIVDLDQAAMWVDESPFASFTGVVISDLLGAGPEIVQLGRTAPGVGSGLYAADIFSTLNVDYQFSETSPGPVYWIPGSAGQSYQANIGVRLLEPGPDGAITDPHGRTIVNTLGNRDAGAPCNIGASEAVLAPGADGTLWVLDRGPRADAREAGGQGREIIELAPGAGRPCPQPTGTFTMAPAQGTSQSAEEVLTVPAGSQVTFDAGSIDLRHGKPFAYEWDLDGDSANGAAHDGFEKVNEMQPAYYFFPPSSVTYDYAQPGRYSVRARVRSDYGVYAPPVATVLVTSPAHPEARFTASVSPGSQSVGVDATASTPGIGAIGNEHWSWGDGSYEDDDPQGPAVIHTYSSPGSYTVKLTVTNTSFQSATSEPQMVSVEAPPPPSADPEVSLVGPIYAIPFPLYEIPHPPSVDRTPTRLSPRLRRVGRALSVSLACPSSKPLCIGTIRVNTAAAYATGKVHANKHRASRLLLGHASFTLAGGKRRSLTIRLSAKAKSLLKQHKRLSVLVTVSAHDLSGNPGEATVRFTLGAS